jgi:predicted GNAT family acetyltransferase
MDFVQNPGTSLQQMLGNANDQAKGFNQLTGQAVQEAQQGGLGGPQVQQLANTMAGAYNPVGMVGKTLSAKYPNVALDIGENPTALNLSRIVVPPEMRGQGVGSNVMKDLIQYADENGKQINLSPSADFGGSPTRLKNFYSRFGFSENRGRNRDFSTTETMVRKPQEIVKESYKGSHTAPNAENYGAFLHDLTQIMPKDVYTVKGKSLYGSGDSAIDSEWWRAAMKAKGNPEAEVDIYRAVPKGVKAINHGDWVTTSPTYAKWHGENVLNGEYDIVSKKAKAKHLSSAGDPQEYGYHEK